MDDCNPNTQSCDYRSFLCFEVCFFTRLFAASMHAESQQLPIQLQYVPHIEFYENCNKEVQFQFHHGVAVLQSNIVTELHLICILILVWFQLENNSFLRLCIKW